MCSSDLSSVLSLAWLYHNQLALDVPPFVLMGMAQLNFAVMMAVVDLVALAQVDNIAVMAVVVVNPTVLADNVVMMVVVEHLVVFVLPPKHVLMVSVSEPPLLIVLQDNVETTELGEAAVLALLVKDVEQDNASAIMTVMREIVVMRLNLMEPILDCAHKDLAEPAQLDLLADPTEDVLRLSNVRLQSPVLTVLPTVPYQSAQQLPLHKAHMLHQ